MSRYQHPYYQTAAQEDRSHWDEQIEAMAGINRGVRKGVRVRHDGTVENYEIRGRA